MKLKKECSRNTFLKGVFLMLGLFLIASCDRTDAPPPGPPPTPIDLMGLFDIRLNNTQDANLLFEPNQKVIYGSPTVNEMFSKIGMRATYIMQGGFVKFSTTENTPTGVEVRNYKCEYDATTGNLSNGTYGSGSSETNLGAFSGQKHIPNAGVNLFKGYWKGKYSTNVNPPSTDFAMLFEENGKFTLAENASFYGTTTYATGTYTVTGNTVTATYIYIGGSGTQFSMRATLSADNKRLNGTWGQDVNTSGLGTFYVDAWNY